MIKITLGLLILIALIVFYPFALIWAVNTLFATSIAFTFKTWLSTFLLAGIFSTASYKVTKR